MRANSRYAEIARQSLRENQPAFHDELKASGKLETFLANLAKQAEDMATRDAEPEPGLDRRRVQGLVEADRGCVRQEPERERGPPAKEEIARRPLAEIAKQAIEKRTAAINQMAAGLRRSKVGNAAGEASELGWVLWRVVPELGPSSHRRSTSRS